MLQRHTHTYFHCNYFLLRSRKIFSSCLLYNNYSQPHKILSEILSFLKKPHSLYSKINFVTYILYMFRISLL